ncbi:hypothetical protein CONLIGDRAFT_586144, partial [Coniochaeta ligniaria NRRL 30616]
IANIDISPYTSIKAVITYVGKYAAKIETKSRLFAEITREILPNISNVSPLFSFVVKLMNKLLGKWDYST